VDGTTRLKAAPPVAAGARGELSGAGGDEGVRAGGGVSGAAELHGNTVRPAPECGGSDAGVRGRAGRGCAGRGLIAAKAAGSRFLEFIQMSADLCAKTTCCWWWEAICNRKRRKLINSVAEAMEYCVRR